MYKVPCWEGGDHARVLDPRVAECYVELRMLG